MKRYFLTALLFWMGIALPAFGDAEEWKGPSPSEEWGFSGMAGLGLGSGSEAAGVIGTVSKKILNRGFVPDINDQAWIEIAGGPYFFRGTTQIFLSAQLRWDFFKNIDWSFYALGGMAALVKTGLNSGNSEFYPRFGIGSMLHLAGGVSIRAELSHEFTGIGIMFWL